MRLFILSAFFCYITVFAENASYTLQDLTQLVQKNEWEEFFLHYKDIPPSKREKYWLKLYAQAIKKSITDQSEKPMELSLYKKIQDQITPSYVSNEAEFQQLYLAYTEKLLTYCFSESTLASEEKYRDCENLWKTSLLKFSFLEELTEPYLLGLESSWPKMTWLHTEDLKQRQWEYIKPLLKKSTGITLCTSAKWHPLLWDQFSKFLSAYKPKKNSSFDVDLNQWVSLSCLKAVVPYLMKRAQDPSTPQERHEVAHFLYFSQALSKEDKTILYTLYLMGKPVPGELMEHAIAHIQSLGLNSLEREVAMIAVQNMTFLPDEVFEKDGKISAQMLKLFSTYFPEYFLYYAKQCALFLTGKEKFAQGNPTPYCHKVCAQFKYKLKSDSYFMAPDFTLIAKTLDHLCK
jgi:hypothetical protein